MAYKKIKKSSLTLTELIFSLIIVFGIFSVMFTYLQTNADEAGVVLDPKYNETNTRLEIQQQDLKDNVDAIKENVNDIKEADTPYQVAWNGLKGLGNTLKLPVNFVSTSIDTASAIMIPLDIIPQKIKNLIFIGIVALVIFLILAILKGDPKL